MATKKISATINYNGKKNSYEIGFSEAPKKDTPQYVAKESIKNEYLFKFYGGMLKLWCRSAEEVSAEDLETIKKMLKDAGFKVTMTIGNKPTTNKKNTKKTQKAMSKAIASQTITKPATKEEPKTEEPKKTEPKKAEPKKSTKKTEPKTDSNEKMELLKQALELQARIVAQIESL